MPSATTGLLGLALALCLLWGAQAQAPEGSLDADASALLEFKGKLANAAALGNWQGNDPCAWTGVNCTDGRVTSLDLQGAGLEGTLPAALSGMGALESLDLSQNKLSGPLPPDWAFPALQNMSLASNELTGLLPSQWASGMPSLLRLRLDTNKLKGTLPTKWAGSGGFDTPFTGVLQSGNTQLCGPIPASAPADGYTLLYRSGPGQTRQLVTTLGSCAQGSCGKVGSNASMPNLYDVSWANGASPLDVAAFNANIQPSTVLENNTPVERPCYPYAPPSFFGGNVAYQKATWQSSTEGALSSALAVSEQGIPAASSLCSTTTDSPGWWIVDLQQSTVVQAVLLYAGTEMQGVEVRVGNEPNATANPVCTGDKSLSTRQGFIYVCDNILPGRYLSVVATQSRLSLCRVEVYSLTTNAALGKPTAASSGNAAAVTDGSAGKASCSSVTSRQDLSAWITVDLGYEAPVSTVIVANGLSTFNGDLAIRLGNKTVVKGDENPPCATGQSIQPINTLPVQCLGVGRYVSLYVLRPEPSTMYICEVYVYLQDGPSAFGPPSPYTPSPAPPSPSSPSPSPSPSNPISPDINSSTSTLDVQLELVGESLSPMTLTRQTAIVTALNDVWTPANGFTDVVFVQYTTVSQNPQTIAIEVYAYTIAGQAPQAATYVVSSVDDGTVAQALRQEGVPTTSVTTMSVDAYSPEPSPGPSPGPAPPPDNGGGSGTSMGVIIGAVAGGVAVIAVSAVLFVLFKRKRRGPSTPKRLAAMEQGRPLWGGSGKDGVGGVDVAARSGGKNAEPSKLLLPDPDNLTQGPPADVLSFLSQDPPDAIALTQQQNGSSTPAAGDPPPRDTLASATSTSLLLKSQKSMGAHTAGGVSELWLVDWRELDLVKQIGEGSFGKVHLAKWRETTVAVKVLSNTGVSSSLEEEFPDTAASPGSHHPLFESLQKEAAMMASLRHPSIVMYLGVCVDPPAVVTEYCARGSLNDVLKRGRGSPSLAAQLDWPRRLNMALDAAKGMLYLHSCNPPIIHRDLKSPNLLVDKHWRVKVCDFNLSRVMEDSVVLSSVAATNPRWLAPEILSGKGYTYASDVYAFGIILWEFLTWQVPWHEYGPWQVVAMVTESQKRPEVPAPEQLPTASFAGQADYLALIQECWAQDPSQRPSFATVISRLRKMLALEAQRQRQRSTLGETPRHGDSPSKATECGGETPMRSRPIVSIYDLSNSGGPAGAGGSGSGVAGGSSGAGGSGSAAGARAASGELATLATDGMTDTLETLPEGAVLQQHGSSGTQ